MALLLDTHALLWWLADFPMADAAREQIADPDTAVFISAASLWEISIKRALGKLQLDLPVGDSVAQHAVTNGFEPLAITWDHGERAGELPRHHADPFDRMLIAQSQLERLTIVTRDRAFDPYGVAVLAC